MIETVEIQGDAGGNTNNSRVCSDIQCKFWVFTLNNYVSEELENLRLYFSEFCEEVVAGFEVGDSGTPHIQGYFKCFKKIRFGTLKKIKGFERCHIEKCKHKIASQAYCQKEGNLFFIKGIKKPVKTIQNMYLWQEKLYKMLLLEPNDRDVLWIYEYKGCTGKSSFVKKIIVDSKKSVGFADGGKKADVLNMIYNLKEDPEIVFFDLPRENLNKVSFKAIESIKNGLIFNSKFETGYRTFNAPHVVVFSNFEPDIEKLSLDRWRIYKIIENDLVECGGVPPPFQRC